MSALCLTHELAHWLRGLLNSKQAPEGHLNEFVVPDDVRDALIEMHFVRRQVDSVEVTDSGIDAIWQYTLAQRDRGA